MITDLRKYRPRHRCQPRHRRSPGRGGPEPRRHHGSTRPCASPAQRDERVVAAAAGRDRSADSIREAAAAVGELTILVNNAGLALYDDLTDPALIQQQLDVNLFGPLNVAQAFLPLLTRSSGAIVNNLSINGVAAFPLIPGYSVSKAAAFSMTQSMRALCAERRGQRPRGPDRPDRHRHVARPRRTEGHGAGRRPRDLRRP